MPSWCVLFEPTQPTVYVTVTLVTMSAWFIKVLWRLPFLPRSLPPSLTPSLPPSLPPFLPPFLFSIPLSLPPSLHPSFPLLYLMSLMCSVCVCC